MDPLKNSPEDLEGWAAPRPGTTLDHTLGVPGSKSLTNRELVLSALAEGTSTIRGGLLARDTELMIRALEKLGATINQTGSGETATWTIEPIRFATLADGPLVIDCGLAGTVMRFIPPLALLGFQPVRFDGDEQAYQRPMSGVIDGLRQLGAKVDDGGRGTLPFEVYPGVLLSDAHTISIDASASSQFVSALLLVAPRLPAPLTIAHTGAKVPSTPHIEMTISCLNQRGVDVDWERSGRWSVSPEPIDAIDVTIEPDLSNAAPFLAAAMLAGGRVGVRNWPQRSTQVGHRIPQLLEAFGGLVEQEDDVLFVHGAGIAPGVALNPVSMDLSEAGELAPTLVTLALFASGTSSFRGIGHLRGHESNRLQALVDNISAVGGVATETDDGLIVTPAPLHAGVWKAFGDHRMATSGALVGLVVDGVVIDDIGETAKTLPEFPELWSEMVGPHSQ